MKKSELLNWLQDEYQQWEAFLDQIGPERMEQPGVNGDWSMKDIVAHLTGWQPRLITRLQAAQRGEPEPPPPWPAHLEAEDEINAWIYETNRGRSVDEVLDESHRVFQQFLAVIEGLPDDVRIEQVHHQRRVYHLVWLGDERFPAGEFFDHFHAAPASRPTSASPRRSTWSRPSATATAGGRWRSGILARCRSRSTTARAGRAGGIRCTPYAF